MTDEEPIIACALDGDGNPTQLPPELEEALMAAVKKLHLEKHKGEPPKMRPKLSKFLERRTATVSKRQTVMDYGYRTGEGTDEDFHVFELPNDDIETARSAILYIAHTDFEALGSPEVITVTIQPGDLLDDGHRAPCIDGSVCGGPHCPPSDTPPQADADE